jgi:hypothetical protein
MALLKASSAAHLHCLVEWVSHQLHGPEADALLHIAALSAVGDSSAAVCASVVAASRSLASVGSLANLNGTAVGAGGCNETDSRLVARVLLALQLQATLYNRKELNRQACLLAAVYRHTHRSAGNCTTQSTSLLL